MDLSFSKKEKKILRLAEKTIKRWRGLLHIDPLWTIYLDVFDDEEMPSAFARIDASSTEYYIATIELSYSTLQMEEDDFLKKIDDIICHELLHLVMIDFFRTAQVAAGEREEMQRELKYKYEQFTSRLQRAFMDIYKKIPVPVKAKEKSEEDKE